MNSSKHGKADNKRGLKRYLWPTASFLIVITIMITLFILRNQVAELGNWGYLGAFLISLIANATVILPMPSLLLLFALGVTFNPVIVGLVGAAGGACGELVGYIAGLSGNTFIKNRVFFIKVEQWMKRWGAVTVFLFAFIPFLPIDVAGLAAGAVRFPIWKFLTACFAGKAILYTGLTLASAWGWDIIQGFFTQAS